MLIGAGISLHLWASVSPAVKWADDSSCLKAVVLSGRGGGGLRLAMSGVALGCYAWERTASGVQWAEAGALQGILPCSEQPPSQRVIWSQMSAVQRVRNATLEGWCEA